METLTEILGLSVHDMGNNMENDDEYVTSKHRKEIGFTAWVDKQPEWLHGISGPFLMPNMNIAWAAYNAGMQFSEHKTIEQHRAEFEDCAGEEGFDLYRHIDASHNLVGEYVSSLTRSVWLLWKAARGIKE